MKLLAILIAMVATPLLAMAEGHPADDARAALDKARDGYEKAEKEFLASIDLIDDAAKKKAVTDAFNKRKTAWQAVMDSDAELKQVASPAPETNTSVSLIPYWSDARHLDQQAKLLREQAKWIHSNWGKAVPQQEKEVER